MRTNVNLDQDAYDYVSQYAKAKGFSLGRALSELVLKARTAPPPPSRLVRGPNGLRIMPHREGQTISQEAIDKARAEGYFG